VTPPVEVNGTYHRVEKGQTLWKISRLYGVEIEDLLAANRLTDSSSLTEGQMVLIPERKQRLPESVAAGAQDQEFIWPLKGRILHRYGEYRDSSVNKGLDIEPAGKKLVLASRSGTVVFYSDNFLDLGKTVIIEHPGGFWTVYSGNSEVFVKTGDYVTRGENIASAGGSGRPDGKNYIHFEIRKGHVPQNPSFYLP